MDNIVIDVREPDEYSSGHVDGAINLPSSKLSASEDELKDVTKDARIIVYCRSGNRANAAQEIIRGWGYTNVTNGVNQEKVEAEYGL
jgi:phage shock protein E